MRTVSEAIGDSRADTSIVERLRGGVIMAVAKQASFELRGKVQPPSHFVLIPPEHWGVWQSDSESDLWGAGDIRVYVEVMPDLHIAVLGGSYSMIVRYFGIRFDPAEIEAMIPRWARGGQLAPPSADNAEQTIQTIADGDPEPETLVSDARKGPPVSEALLREWYELYSKAYAGPADTEKMALASATGMFPTKSVSRSKVRELRGERKRGQPSAKVE